MALKIFFSISQPYFFFVCAQDEYTGVIVQVLKGLNKLNKGKCLSLLGLGFDTQFDLILIYEFLIRLQIRFNINYFGYMPGTYTVHAKFSQGKKISQLMLLNMRVSLTICLANSFTI